MPDLITAPLHFIRTVCGSGFVFYGTILSNLGHYLQGVERVDVKMTLEILDILFFTDDDVAANGLLLVFMRRVPIVIMVFAVFAVLVQACFITRHVAWAALILSLMAWVTILRLVLVSWRLGLSAGQTAYYQLCMASERLPIGIGGYRIDGEFKPTVMHGLTGFLSNRVGVIPLSANQYLQAGSASFRGVLPQGFSSREKLQRLVEDFEVEASSDHAASLASPSVLPHTSPTTETSDKSISKHGLSDLKSIYEKRLDASDSEESSEPPFSLDMQSFNEELLVPKFSPIHGQSTLLPPSSFSPDYCGGSSLTPPESFLQETNYTRWMPQPAQPSLVCQEITNISCEGNADVSTSSSPPTLSYPFSSSVWIPPRTSSATQSSSVRKAPMRTRKNAAAKLR